MIQRFVGFIGPSYESRSKNVDAQRCINLYPELNELGTGKEKEVASLIWTPGLSSLCTVGDGPIRGAYTASNGELFVVSGSKCYQVSNGWAATELGTLNTATGLVSMADNGTTLVIVDGSFGYTVTFSSDAFAQILDGDFQPASQVFFLDGYFLFIKTNSKDFFISGINAVTFDALDFATVEGTPDNLVGGIVDHRDIYLFKEASTEIYYNSGDADFPFARAQNAFIEVGCAAKFSIAKMNHAVFWLGKDDKGSGVVYRAQGYQPQKISTHAVEAAIQGYSEISDAVAYTYQENGHYFYVLNFPTADTTWVFDASTNLWHERMYLNDGVFERHRANLHTIAHSKRVVADYENGSLYEMSSDFFDDDGVEIVAQRVAPHYSSDGQRIRHNSFELDFETGVGLNGTAQGSDPKVVLTWSDDHGHTWSNEKWASMGKIGARLTRAIWRRLGMSRDRVYKVTITDPIKRVIIGANIDVEKGAS